MKTFRIALLTLVALLLLVVTAANPGFFSPSIDVAQALDGSISGTVTNESGGGPLSGIDVCAYEDGEEWLPGQSPAGCDTTDAFGVYSVGGLSAGDYVVLFQDPSGAYAFEWYNDKLNAPSADLVTVAEGTNTPGIDAALGPGGSISGTVTAEGSGLPLSGIDVCPEWLEGWGRWDFWFACDVTDWWGGYTLVGLPTLDYNVEFRDPSGTYATEWYDDQPDGPSADKVPVSAGVNTPDIDAALELGGSISGTVTAEGSGALSGITVCAHHEQLVPRAPWVFGVECAGTDGAGAYSVRGLGTGNYNVEFQASGIYGFEWYNDKDSIHSGDLVAVTGGADTPGIDAALPLAGSISGTVTNEITGDPLSGIGVCPLGPGPPWHFWPRCVGTDDAGAYSAGGLRPGDYAVSFLDQSRTYISEYYSDKWHSSTADPVSVTGGADTGGINGTLIEDVPGLLKVGILFAFTGSLADLGPELMRGAELAAKHLKQGGGVNGLPVPLIVGDSQTDPTAAVNAAQRGINDYGVQAIVGAVASGVTFPVAQQVTIPSGVLLISPSSTASTITTLADDDLVFRTIYSDVLQGAALAQVAWDAGFGTACTMYIDGAYGQGISNSFTQAFQALGGTVQAEVPHGDQESYLDELNDCIASGTPDVLAAMSYPQHGLVYLDEALDNTLIDQFVFADGLKSEDMFKALDDEHSGAFEGMYGTAPGSSFTPEFSSAYEAEYGEPPSSSFIAEAYDAVVSIALAAETAGSTDSAAIRDALRGIACPPGPSIGAGATAVDQGLQLAGAGDHLDYEGGTGSLQFNEYGDATSGMVEVWKVQGDGIVHDREEPVAAEPDADGDGFDVCVEVYVGTDFLDGCPETSTPNDEDPDAWPLDMDDDQDADVFDVMKYIGYVGVIPPVYSQRLDLDVDGDVDIFDVMKFVGVVAVPGNDTCT